MEAKIDLERVQSRNRQLTPFQASSKSKQRFFSLKNRQSSSQRPVSRHPYRKSGALDAHRGPHPVFEAVKIRLLAEKSDFRHLHASIERFRDNDIAEFRREKRPCFAVIGCHLAPSAVIGCHRFHVFRQITPNLCEGRPSFRAKRRIKESAPQIIGFPILQRRALRGSNPA